MASIEGLTPHPQGCCLSVLCQPGSKRNHISDWHDKHLRVHLLAQAIEGKANEALQRLLAQLLCIKRRDVQLLSGEHSKRKRVLLQGLSLQEASHRILEIQHAIAQA